MQILIYSIIFFSFFDLFAQLPIMSTFAQSVGASAFITGLAVGMYSFSNTFGNIISGIWTDRKGAHIVLIAGLLLTGSSHLLYALIDGPTILLIVRFLHGLFSGLIVPAAFTFLANTTSSNDRGKNSAITGAFVGTAAITGPAFSGILASYISVPYIFRITAVFMILIGFLSIVFLKKQPKKNIKKTSLSPEFSTAFFLHNPGLLKAFLGAFFLMFSQGVIAYLLPLRIQELGFDSKVTGTLLSTFGIVAVFIFLLPTNRIFDKVMPIYTLSFGVALMGASQLLLSNVDNLLLLYMAMAFYGIGFSFLFPSINSLLIDSTNEKVRGKAYGYFYACFSFGVVIGSSLLGWFSLEIQQGFILTGFILLLFAFLIIVTKKNKPSHV